MYWGHDLDLSGHVTSSVMWTPTMLPGIPATKEPLGLNRQDGKRPDGLTLIPWQGGKPLVWDVTVATLAPSYADTATTGVGRVADQAANMKSATTSCIFQPIAVENLGPINSSALSFLNNLGQRMCTVSGNNREVLFLFQRISVMIQCFNYVLLHDSFCIDCPDH